MDEAPPTLPTLLERYRPLLVRLLRREASGLQHRESAEDLAQGIHLHVLGVADRFQWRGEAAFRAWLRAVARRYVARRHAHWSARKRDAGFLLRVTSPGSTDPRGRVPAGRGPGPITWADRREQIGRARRAMAALPSRDRTIVRLLREEATLPDLATALGLSIEAAKSARRRALDRFRKVYLLLAPRLADTPA